MKMVTWIVYSILVCLIVSKGEMRRRTMSHTFLDKQIVLLHVETSDICISSFVLATNENKSRINWVLNKVDVIYPWAIILIKRLADLLYVPETHLETGFSLCVWIYFITSLFKHNSVGLGFTFNETFLSIWPVVVLMKQNMSQTVIKRKCRREPMIMWYIPNFLII